MLSFRRTICAPGGVASPFVESRAAGASSVGPGTPAAAGRRRIDTMPSEKKTAAPAWDERILSLVDAGVDGTLIEENLRRTPTERLRRMQEMARFIELARDRRPAPA
jgi:hypothetical protein